MTGKKFKFRSDFKGNVGVKEVVLKGNTQRGRRLSVSVGLDERLQLLPKYTIQDNCFIPLDDVSKLKQGRGGKAVYYLFSDISYVVTITLQYNKKDKIVERILTLYKPESLCSANEVYCTRITGSLKEEQMEYVFQMLIPYIESRG